MHTTLRPAVFLAPLSLSLVVMLGGCTDPIDERGTLSIGETCESSSQCGDALACFDDDDGTATCGCADSGFHDGGDGTCVSRDQCVAGYHNGGDRSCVPEGQCIAGIALTGDDCLSAASPECLQYVECVEHFDEINGSSTTGTDEAYGNGGICWEDADTAEACTEACASAVISLNDSLDAAGEPVGPCE